MNEKMKDVSTILFISHIEATEDKKKNRTTMNLTTEKTKKSLEVSIRLFNLELTSTRFEDFLISAARQ